MSEVKVEGMKCDGCVKTVTEKLSGIVRNVEVDLADQSAKFTGEATIADLNGALADTPYRVVD
ncbi:hypothetical protein FC99_GL000580 [Levilactobacillus koreensis JCM 16448]|uniref:HMA domain-containing protein n=1 Tax=Levilactobacillus koreensis TaxID=637971 RepID=A0AAC8UUZ7_9LACO|nr:hypothetical protein ABN16_04645 [Levilactobacillus koreensis]KRK88486.1 hypothetical protein FC99_GL000580 [Levilactobacillus koreensis JCM 16448]